MIPYLFAINPAIIGPSKKAIFLEVDIIPSFFETELSLVLSLTIIPEQVIPKLARIDTIIPKIITEYKLVNNPNRR